MRYENMSDEELYSSGEMTQDMCCSAQSAGLYLEQQRRKRVREQQNAQHIKETKESTLRQEELQKNQVNELVMQNEKLSFANDTLSREVDTLKETYSKVSDLYEQKCNELEASKKEIRRSHIFNSIMLGLAICSFVATIVNAVV